jgi:transcriptional regulator GlxA family with amidase domain
VRSGRARPPGRAAAAEAGRPRGTGRPALQTGLYERARHHIERRLDDPGLRAATLASELGVPLRTLQDVFAQRGETISEPIRTLRLGRCHTDLQRADGRTVTEIAFAHGFTDSSHFSRIFREHYGLTAREVQAAAAARAAV